ncbi:5167_t:CDS:1, partial [Gigaspora margarita]
KMANKDEFDFSNLCFASNAEPNMLDETLNKQPQLIDETNDLTAPETETDKFTNLEKEYIL